MEVYSFPKYKKPISPLAIVPFVVFILSVCFYQASKAQCINVYPHVDDFETAPTWTAYTAPTSTWTSSDWAWGTPNHTYVIKSAGSGTKCWCVGGLTGSFYNFWEQSYVLSPCYDFTNLKYPHVQFKLFYDSEYEYDGANLQSSIDGGVTWQDVGTVGGTKTKPIREATDCNTANWYNYTSIEYLNKPTGFVTSTHGWCGNKELGGKGWDQTPGNTGVTCVGDSGIGHWVTAQHCLTGLAGQPNVQLRFTFGGGFTCNDFDGFAFDSVAVSNGIPNTTSFNSTCGAGNTLNFTVPSVACPTTTWAWNFGDAASGAANTAATENASHTFSAPGTYTVTLIASGGNCNPPDTATKVVHIMNASITSFTNATCNILGAAAALATGGTAPVYTWSNGANTATATGLSAGTYTVTMTDPAACPTMTTVTITQPTPIVITLSSTAATCNTNNGTATATSVTGGTGTYTYSWNGTAGVIGTNTTSISNLAIGNYTLTVTDANACTATQTVTVKNSSGLNVTVTSSSVSCNGGANGSITVNATGGTGTLSYSWSPMGGGTKTTTLSAGTYTVAVSDASPCTVTNIITINQPTALTATATSSPATCGQSNGSATISVSGGTVPYNTTYTWSPSGGSSATAVNLSGNTYSVTIADANGCLVTAQTTVTQQSSINLSVTNTPAKCGINNGTATALATGGTGTITYTWTSPTGGAITGGNSNAATALAPGAYTISVSDAMGCIKSLPTIVGNNPSPVLSTTSSNVLCFGTSTGSASVTINTGTGTSPFIYSWSPTGGAGPVATNLSAGASTAGITYTVFVSDAVNCKDSAVVTITQPPALTITATGTQGTCGKANGSTTCTTAGGVPAYSYTWTPSGGNLSTSSNLLGPKTFTVTVKDANNCMNTASVFVNETPALVLPVPTTTNVTCYGGVDGLIAASASGGTGSPTYTWLPSGGNLSTASSLTAAVTGTTYTVLATDNVGCFAMNAATITEPPPIAVLVNSPTICDGFSTILTATASGGNGSPPSYTWTPGGASTTAITVHPTSSTQYIVSVENTGCSQVAMATATVNVYPAVTITITPADSICKGQQTTLSATAGGGDGTGFLYNWSTNQSGPSIVVRPGSTTVYSVTAQDQSCPPIDTTTKVNVFINPAINLVTTPTPYCGAVSVSFTASATNVPGNNISSNYTWYFGDGSTITGTTFVQHEYSQTGSYDVMLIATTQHNCIDTLKKLHFINVHPKPIADFAASTYETNIDNATIHFYNQSTGNDIVTLNWFIDTTTSSVQNPFHTFLNEGTYPITLIVTDSMGCKDTIIKDIIITPDYTFYAPNCLTPNGDGKNEAFIPVGTGWDNTSYNLWIYDRWGVQVMHSTNPDTGWNGTRHDGVVQQDTYVWEVSLSDIFGKPHSYHGIVSVVR